MSFIPNTTPNPNWLYDGEMKKMNETELKVVLLVTRKTLGWFDPLSTERKIQDYISQSQFMEFTGQNSSHSIAKAIQSSVDNGWIIAKDKDGNLCNTPEMRARRKIWYQLGDIQIRKKPSGSQSAPESGSQNASHLVHKVNSTKETITKENKDSRAKPLQDTSLIPEVIKMFESVNPACKRYYGIPVQRKACQDLLDTYGLEELTNVIKFLPLNNSTPYKPKANTPLQLWEKYQAIKDAWKQENNISNSKKATVAFS